MSLLSWFSNEHTSHMNLALQLAREGFEAGNGPAGAVIVLEKRVIGASSNRVFSEVDPTAHSELSAIREACRRRKTLKLNGATLYATIEPCPMCAMAALEAGIRNFVIGLRLDDLQSNMLGTYSLESLAAMVGREVNVIAGVRAEPIRELLFDALEKLGRNTVSPEE